MHPVRRYPGPARQEGALTAHSDLLNPLDAQAGLEHCHGSDSSAPSVETGGPGSFRGVPDRRPRRRLSVRGQLLAVPRVPAAEGRAVRDALKGRRSSGSTCEPGARRQAPAGRRLPAAGVPHPSRRRYPVLYLLHGVPGPAARVPRHGADGRRRGRARRPREGAAADPRDAVRVDGDVHRQGVGERRPPAERLGDIRVARPRPCDRRALPHDPQRARPRGSAGSPRADTARSTSRSGTRASSASSRAGRATSWPRGSR